MKKTRIVVHLPPSCVPGEPSRLPGQDSLGGQVERRLLLDDRVGLVHLYVSASPITWRKVYADRVAMGVIGAAFQLVDAPNDVTIWHDFETVEVARAFVSSDALRNVMQRAGVQGDPQIWFTTESWRPTPSI